MENVNDVWREITAESARFLLEQAEKKVQATIDTARSLTDRAVNVMQFSIPLCLALVGLIGADPKKEFLWLYLIILALSIAISYMGLHLYDLYTIRTLGYKPSLLLKEENLGFRDEYQHLGFLFGVIQDIERVIEINEDSNRERQRIMYWIMTLIKFTIGFTCLYLVLVLPLFLFLVTTG